MSERWHTDRLGKYCYIKARIGWRGLSASEYTESGPYLIAGKHIEQGIIDWDACDHISEFRYRESSEIALAAGDVILTKDGTIGRVARVDSLPGNATINGTMMLIRPERGIDYRFLYHLLNGAGFKKLVEDKVSGSSIPHIFQRDMVTLPISFPPIEHQAKLAQILDTIDTVIQETEVIIAKLKSVKHGLLHDLLTRGIDANGELRPPHSEAPHLYKPSQLGCMPKGWECCPIAFVLTGIDAGKSPDCQDIPAAGDQWGVLKVGAVHPDGLRLHENKVVELEGLKNPAYLVRDGDLLFSRANTYELVGLVCHVANSPKNLMLSDKTLRLAVNNSRMVTRYLFWQLQHPRSRTQIAIQATGTSGSMKNITQTGVGQIRIVRPPLEEQLEILKRIDAGAYRYETERNELSKLEALKLGLMDDLLTGCVRVTPLLKHTKKGIT